MASTYTHSITQLAGQLIICQSEVATVIRLAEARMIGSAALVIIVLAGTHLCSAQGLQEPMRFFREQVALSDDQIMQLSLGKPVAKVLPSKNPAEMIVFGAVFVRASPDAYIKLAFDIDRLRRSPGYSGAGQLHQPPDLSDLNGFDLEPSDMKSLSKCKPGKCAVQLPAKMIHDLQASIDWSKPDAAAQVNTWFRRTALEILLRYQKIGNMALPQYHDSDSPFDVNGEIQSLLERSEALPMYLPALKSYLLNYPTSELKEAESIFYWERVNFGMKPTLRLNHAVTYRSDGPGGPVPIVVVKQLFARHYFQLALDLSACVLGTSRLGDSGFYLISLRGSTQSGFTGLFGALLKKLVASKTRAMQEKALLNIKQELESRPGALDSSVPIHGGAAQISGG
ncbi:MAG: hypothetical protein HXY18_17835 [Bryobacteraceae bacterium]|nr:hypothetical protein [Bryobacteraceae bacterium]